jgi:capsular exopolysaccharide synthesis family protein
MESSSRRPPLELGDYLYALRRRWWLIVFVAAGVVGSALYWSSKQDKVYETSASIVLHGQNIPQTYVATEMQIITSQTVHDLALRAFPEAGSVSTRQGGSANIIIVTARASSPSAAADTVVVHADAYVNYHRQVQLDQYLLLAQDVQGRLNDVLKQISSFPPQPLPAPGTVGTGNPELDALIIQRDALTARLRALQFDTSVVGSDVSVISRGAESRTPVEPRPRDDALLALGAGLLLGIILALLLEYMDDTIKTRDDLQRASGDDVPVLALLPSFRTRRLRVKSRAARIAATEAFRSLRTALSFVSVDRGCSIEITSPLAQEGKTQTAVNLARVMARAGKQVILVDCNLRRPGIHRFMDLPNEVGLTSVILGEPISAALQSVPGVGNLQVLTSGPLPPDPSEMLASARCRAVLRELRSDKSIVLIDTTPILPVTDAAVLAGSVDAVVLVAKGRRTTSKQVWQAMQVLRHVGAPVVGTVLTRPDDSAIGFDHKDVGPVRRWRKRNSQDLWIGSSADYSAAS